jgi:hypothetical protein
VEDFLTVHVDELLASADKETGDSTSPEENDTKRIHVIPLGMVEVQDLLRMSNLSILTMLITCLYMNSIHRYQVAELLVRLVLTTKDLHNSLPVTSDIRSKSNEKKQRRAT